MRSFLTIIGVLLIIAGIVFFAYHGFSYTTQEQVAQIGGLNITAQTQKVVHFPPMLGGASIVAGIILVIIGRKVK